MSEKENLKDQFDTLFSDTGENSEIENAAREAGKMVDDTMISDDFEEIDFEDLDNLIRETPVNDEPEEVPAEEKEVLQEAVKEAEETVTEEAEDITVNAEEEAAAAVTAAEEAVPEAPEEFFEEQETAVKEPAKEPSKESVKEPAKETLKGGLTPEERDRLKKESRHFWLFTALIALIVVGSVLYILQRRGIIFNDDTTPSSQVIVTTPDAESSSTEASTSETTEESTPSESESSSDESTSESETEDTKDSESAETDTTADTSASESDTSASESESDTSSESESGSTDEVNVLDNYENIFIISGAEMVNVRAEASTESRILAKIPEFGGGEVLNPDENGWVRISSNGFVGFVSADYVKTGEEAEKLAKEHAIQMVHVDSDSLNLRSASNTDSDVLETVLYDTLWEYLGEENGFYHVVYTSYMEGYLSKDYSTLGWFLRGASSQY